MFDPVTNSDPSSKNVLIDLIRELFQKVVINQPTPNAFAFDSRTVQPVIVGQPVAEAYWLDNWMTDEGILVDGVTSDALIYEGDGQMPRLEYRFSEFSENTLKEALSLLQDEAFT